MATLRVPVKLAAADIVWLLMVPVVVTLPVKAEAVLLITSSVEPLVRVTALEEPKDVILTAPWLAAVEVTWIRSSADPPVP